MNDKDPALFVMVHMLTSGIIYNEHLPLLWVQKMIGKELKTISRAKSPHTEPLYIQVTEAKTYQGSATWLAIEIVKRNDWEYIPGIGRLIAELIEGWCDDER